MKTDLAHLQKYLAPLNISSLNELQQSSLAQYSPEKDMLLLAPTGTGKTLAFFLPLLDSLKADEEYVQLLILVPSRELALQLEQVFRAMRTGCKVNCCYGGHSMRTEINNLSHPPAVLIGTPGRIADHFRRKTFDPRQVRTLVLDEFDKSLELGFEEDMQYIIRKLPALESRVLTSATNMQRVPAFVGINNPVVVDFLDTKATPKLEYFLIEATSAEKVQALFQLICTIGAQPTIVFCNHREAVERIRELLTERGIVHGSFHGGMDQEERERVLVKFRNGTSQLLVSTDLAARGLDIPTIKHIVHYQLPASQEAFIHRNGRTARMDAEGNTYLFVTENDQLPPYIDATVTPLPLNEEAPLPPLPEWETLYISGGKKDKINKVDIVGLLLKKGGLQKEQLGLIEVKDTFAYAAVDRKEARKVAQKVNNEKLKKKKVRVQIARD